MLLSTHVNDPLARVLLSVAAFATYGLAVGLLSSAELRWEMMTAGLLGLLVYNVGYPTMPRQRVPQFAGGPALGRHVPRNSASAPSSRSQQVTAASRRDPARLPQRLLPDALSPSHGLAILDRDFHVVWCNDSAAAHFGINAQHDIGRPIATLARHPSLAAYLAAGDFSQSLQMRMRESDGPALSIQIASYVADRWLLLSHNVTRAARLETTRRECIANVSHELRNPLTLLVGLLEAVREHKLDDGSSRDYLDRMEQQCRRMQRIIEDLLQFSVLESDPEPSGGTRVNVGKMLARIQTEAKALSAGRHRIVLEADDGFDLLGAESEIASAFGNLASNAIRYTETGGAVRIIWRASSVGAELTVEDTGVGIAREHIPRLTERFYRVDRDRSCRSGGAGLGLGLSIVKQALQRHQAALEIESEPGKGSRFTARFPAHRVIPVTT